jgi:tRNA A37 threonylcarbamoyladenosine modification protein TsaB
LKKASQQHDILIISIASPFLVGLYENGELVETFESSEKISDSLLELLLPLVEKYDINSIVYTSGPGSHMGTKLAYIIVKTIEIIKNIKCKGILGFECNGNLPIKALGNLYFIKEKENIIIKKFELVQNNSFSLPKNLEMIKLEENEKPIHILPAV